MIVHIDADATDGLKFTAEPIAVATTDNDAKKRKDDSKLVGA